MAVLKRLELVKKVQDSIAHVEAKIAVTVSGDDTTILVSARLSLENLLDDIEGDELDDSVDALTGHCRALQKVADEMRQRAGSLAKESEILDDLANGVGALASAVKGLKGIDPVG